MSAINSLQKILQKSKLKKGLEYTHTGMGGIFTGAYNLDRKNIEKFWENYSNSILDENNFLSLTERPQHYIPVLVDVDIKLSIEKDKDTPTLYCEEHLFKLVNIYINILPSLISYK